MAKITIEIECKEFVCGECRKQYGDLNNDHFRYCSFFQRYLGDNRQGEITRCANCLAAEVKEKTDELSFGDYVLIEQKRYGAENEMYLHKVIGTSASNEWVDVPVQSPATATLHHVKELEPVVSCICCGVCETKVLKYRVKDVKTRNIPHE